MILEIKVPSPGESINEVEISNWLVSNGQYVEKDQEICEIDSDKATLTVSAEDSGVISILKESELTIPVGEVICKIDTSAKNTNKSVAINKKQEEEKIEVSINQLPESESIASPAAKKIMREKNIDQNIIGSGKGGRITKQDVIKSKPAMGNAFGERNQNRKRLSSLRRKLAARLVSVKNETAMLTTFNEIDMTAINEVRSKYKDDFYEKHSAKLGFMSFFTKSVTRALDMFPDVNSMIDGDELVSFDYKDISIAVSSPKGLVVPVLRNAQDMSFDQAEQEIMRLANKARNGSISVDDMIGGTFTITNGGVFGSMLSTPIINPPQSAILGMHNIVERPVAIEGKVVIRPIMYVALSYDHRIIDGKQSVGFLVAVKEALENPVEHLLGGQKNIKKNLGL
ncbi:MAG: dihydrolipoyllysine-residue succinyltransferase [Flavobacteriales bacterium]|nr:dihydrolipoyllysine-residue succinyltransferase [Flavobacteriales bacterium]